MDCIKISQPVGFGKPNKKLDVITIQKLLNDVYNNEKPLLKKEMEINRLPMKIVLPIIKNWMPILKLFKCKKWD